MSTLASFLPTKLVLRVIERQCAYLHQKSKEEGTQVEKSKYKLAGNSFPEIKVYIFFILTSNSAACDGYTTIEIQENDWEERKKKHLRKVSYLDVKKVQTLDATEVADKLKEGGFYKVARLSNNKFTQLEKLCVNARSQTATSERKKNLLALAVSDIREIDTSEVTQFIEKYNI